MPQSKKTRVRESMSIILVLSLIVSFIIGIYYLYEYSNKAKWKDLRTIVVLGVVVRKESNGKGKVYSIIEYRLSLIHI